LTADALVLVVLAFGFAWSIGAHYTGACMGMPYATGSIRLWPALATMAVFVVIGASFLSHRVLATVGHHLLQTNDLRTDAASAIIAAAFILTMLYNRLKIPCACAKLHLVSDFGLRRVGCDETHELSRTTTILIAPLSLGCWCSSWRLNTRWQGSPYSA
jgi:hypothetical protein